MAFRNRSATGIVLAALSCLAPVHGAAAQGAPGMNRIVAGLGAAVIPTFEGSDRLRVLPFPVVDVKQGPFFFNLAEGAGMLLVSDDAVSVGASVALVGGYRRRDVPDGVDRVRFAPGARIFSRLRFGGFVFGVGGTRALGGTDGILADATLSYPVRIATRVIVTPSATTTWANRRHMNRYFGISSREAAASGLPRFEADAGFKNVGGSLNGIVALNDRISLTATLGASRLLNDAVDSPINQRRWNASGFAGVAYRF